jgi:hypothetical protein
MKYEFFSANQIRWFIWKFEELFWFIVTSSYPHLFLSVSLISFRSLFLLNYFCTRQILATDPRDNMKESLEMNGWNSSEVYKECKSIKVFKVMLSNLSNFFTRTCR